jgi:hypothetical protein
MDTVNLKQLALISMRIQKYSPLKCGSTENEKTVWSADSFMMPMLLI